MTDTITRPTLAIGQRVTVNAPTYLTDTTGYPWEGIIHGTYDVTQAYGSVFVVPSSDAHPDHTYWATVEDTRRSNRTMVASGSVVFAPIGDDESKKGQWVALEQIESAREPLDWATVRRMRVGDRLLVSSPRPSDEPYPATIISVTDYNVRIQYDEGRGTAEGTHGNGQWNLSEYPDWAAFRLDSEPTPSAPTNSEGSSDTDAQLAEAREVLRMIGAALLDTADRSEWCDEYDRKLQRLYDSLPGQFGFDDVFNDAAKRDDAERDFIVNISGHVHVSGFPNEDAAIEYANEHAERLVREAWANGCFEIDGAEPED